EAAKVFAVGISRMRADRDASAQRLLDGDAHRVFVARVATAGDVRGCDRAQQRFLRAVSNRLGQLPHVAIQIDAGHVAPCLNDHAIRANDFLCGYIMPRFLASLGMTRWVASGFADYLPP